MTPRVDSMLAFALDIVITWSDQTGSLRSSHTCFGIATISEPESSTLRMVRPVPMIFTSRDWRGMVWCVTIRPSSLW